MGKTKKSRRAANASDNEPSSPPIESVEPAAAPLTAMPVGSADACALAELPDAAFLIIGNILQQEMPRLQDQAVRSLLGVCRALRRSPAIAAQLTQLTWPRLAENEDGELMSDTIPPEQLHTILSNWPAPATLLSLHLTCCTAPLLSAVAAAADRTPGARARQLLAGITHLRLSRPPGQDANMYKVKLRGKAQTLALIKVLSLMPGLQHLRHEFLSCSEVSAIVKHLSTPAFPAFTSFEFCSADIENTTHPLPSICQALQHLTSLSWSQTGGIEKLMTKRRVPAWQGLAALASLRKLHLSFDFYFGQPKQCALQPMINSVGELYQLTHLTLKLICPYMSTQSARKLDMQPLAALAAVCELSWEVDQPLAEGSMQAMLNGMGSLSRLTLVPHNLPPGLNWPPTLSEVELMKSTGGDVQVVSTLRHINLHAAPGLQRVMCSELQLNLTVTEKSVDHPSDDDYDYEVPTPQADFDAAIQELVLLGPKLQISEMVLFDERWHGFEKFRDGICKNGFMTALAPLQNVIHTLRLIEYEMPSRTWENLVEALPNLRKLEIIAQELVVSLTCLCHHVHKLTHLEDLTFIGEVESPGTSSAIMCLCTTLAGAARIGPPIKMFFLLRYDSIAKQLKAEAPNVARFNEMLRFELDVVIWCDFEWDVMRAGLAQPDRVQLTIEVWDEEKVVVQNDHED